MGCSAVSKKEEMKSYATAKKVEEKKIYAPSIDYSKKIKIIVTPDESGKFLNMNFPLSATLGEVADNICNLIPKNAEFIVCSNTKNIYIPKFAQLKLYEILKPNDTQFNVEIKYLGMDIPEFPKKAYTSTNFIAKPMISPFYLIIFDKNKNDVEYEFFKNDIEKHPSLESLDEFFTYCNGMDYIFISHNYNKFTFIDLSKRKIFESQNQLINKRTAHSMLFVPNSYIFFIGGKETTKVEYYDMNRKNFFEHSDLSELRVDPSVALINSFFLYAFSGYNSMKKALYNFERINLRSESKKWEKLDFNLENIIFKRSLFGISYHTKNEVMLLGGIDKNNDNEIINTSNVHVFNYNDRKLKLASANGIKADFKEKFLLPIQDKLSLLFPYKDFENQDNISMVIYDGNNVAIKKYDNY